MRVMDYVWLLITFIALVLAAFFAVHDYITTFWFYKFLPATQFIESIKALSAIAIDPIIAILVLKTVLSHDVASGCAVYFLFSLRCGRCQYRQTFFKGCTFSCVCTIMQNAVSWLGSFIGWDHKNNISVQNFWTLLIVVFMSQCWYKMYWKRSTLTTWNMLIIVNNLIGVCYLSGLSLLQFAYLLSFTLVVFHTLANNMSQDWVDAISENLLIPDVKEVISFMFQVSFTGIGLGIYYSFGYLCGDCMVNSVFEHLLFATRANVFTQIMQTFFVQWALYVWQQSNVAM